MALLVYYQRSTLWLIFEYHITAGTAVLNPRLAQMHKFEWDWLFSFLGVEPMWRKFRTFQVIYRISVQEGTLVGQKP